MAECLFADEAASCRQGRIPSPGSRKADKALDSGFIAVAGDRVFLEQADSLYRPANEYEEFQIVKGSVIFRHGNMWMFCDSAWYYPEKTRLMPTDTSR